MIGDGSTSGVGKSYDEIWEDFKYDKRFSSLDEIELRKIHDKWMKLGKKLAAGRL